MAFQPEAARVDDFAASDHSGLTCVGVDDCAFLRLHLKNTFELGGANDARSLVLGATAEEQDSFVDVVMNGGGGGGSGGGGGGGGAGAGAGGAWRGSGASGDDEADHGDGRGGSGQGGNESGSSNGNEVDIAIIDQNVECNGVVRHRGIDLAWHIWVMYPLSHGGVPPHPLLPPSQVRHRGIDLAWQLRSRGYGGIIVIYSAFSASTVSDHVAKAKAKQGRSGHLAGRSGHLAELPGSGLDVGGRSPGLPWA